MSKKHKIYFRSKNTGQILINESIINSITGGLSDKIFMSIIIDKDYILHCVLSKEVIKTKNNIYYICQNIRKNNDRSKDYNVRFNYIFISLFKVNSNICTLKKFFLNNKCYYEVVFNSV